MPTLLQIESSPRSGSITSKLAAKYVAAWKRQNPGGVVIQHNTAKEELPYIDEAFIAASYTAPEQRTAEQKTALALSDRLVDELLSADEIVLAVPMWNFGIPASFKSWIDLVARVGRTFQYSKTGVEGLVKAKKTFVVTARGGAYAGDSPYNFLDQQEPYLRTVLGFLGVKDIQFIHAENQSRAPELAAAGLQHAENVLATATA